MKEGEQQKVPIEELDTVGHALSAGNSNDSLIRIFYPKSSSKLLQNDVVIVDSPGVDVSAESDAWIDKHCLDADVFVLVCNSESTLTKSEKDFFHRVSAKLAHPNVFILNNRLVVGMGRPCPAIVGPNKPNFWTMREKVYFWPSVTNESLRTTNL